MKKYAMSCCDVCELIGIRLIKIQVQLKITSRNKLI